MMFDQENSNQILAQSKTMPVQRSQRSDLIITQKSQKESLLSLSGSLDLDNYDIEDEVATSIHL